MNERKLIREFLDMSSGTCSGCGYSPCRCDALCDCCGCEICQCPPEESSDSSDYSLDSMNHGEAHHDMEFDMNGNISPEELHHHFDLDDDGIVTPQEYVDHIQYHAAHPESLEHYNQLRNQSHQTVPCKDSYDSCSQHLMSNPDDIDIYLRPLMDVTGSSCVESSLKSIMDVVQSLVKCGVFK